MIFDLKAFKGRRLVFCYVEWNLPSYLAYNIVYEWHAIFDWMQQQTHY